MWGGDDTHFMLAMDKAHDLNGQVQDLCHNCDIVWEGKTLGFKCVITGFYMLHARSHLLSPRLGCT